MSAGPRGLLARFARKTVFVGAAGLALAFGAAFLAFAVTPQQTIGPGLPSCSMSGQGQTLPCKGDGVPDGGPALIARASCGGIQDCTTPAMDTTGANFIVVGLSTYETGAYTPIWDSLSNSWTCLTNYGTENYSERLCYTTPTAVGASHTFTTGESYVSMFVAAFSGMATSSVFQSGTDSGTTAASGSTIQPGSISPTGSSLVITGAMGTQSTAAVDTGFTITDQTSYGGVGTQYAGALAYLVQSSGSAVNPTWTLTGNSTPMATAIAAFKGQ